ncbi:hypothetical protein FJ942_09725 [Mesorhizobium sp. B2-4-2]|uniref:hypothetical protein n=1 Tax=unclassified Mesorhizobium TaxID=325217 RepID=UPI00112AF075|nr:MULTISPECIES: hypothetical protein [unclassified Mesorhizobium]MBZ9922112.1 hypothetical protein [Mesorhizobium sp. BR1-1-7]MBZ9956728.1 hypothetical protein [Mesorhizobium sp. BR1-1-14]MBZ9970250.1 hypothetical protein [Mesorhizobium sp. BR1-1-12]TPL58932.1 hypothetical protein FJ942_09725 [Mesorhizobium sp. B2-4-2]TPN58024.1 hypothetical protein FJ981_08740 [Mesorhizobium sp. B1-1-4]
MLGVEGWKIAWGVVFLIVEFVLIYGAVHHIINPEIRNSRDAKRFNESVKYAASAINALAVGMIGGSVVVPAINHQDLQWWSLAWAIGGFALHTVGHLVLSLLRKEDGYE